MLNKPALADFESHDGRALGAEFEEKREPVSECLAADKINLKGDPGVLFNQVEKAYAIIVISA